MKQRILSGMLALLLLLACPLSAGAYGLDAAYDETYYATLDYYGAPTQASVVKSYLLRGQTTVTDYGVYDEVINLTDSSSPVIDGGKLTFTPTSGAEKFYFEGRTTQPFDDLPWTISVSYKLNGAPALAEDLAGKTGLVEIDVDAVPNPAAPEYLKTNLVLTVAAAFSDDDITSLSAPGGQIQLIGNLRTVLLAVLPGEEQHFAIQVGADSFSCSGLLFLAVPATLGQLEKVADLKEAKEDLEDSADTLSDSLDAILDSLDGMTGSLNATAAGLDRLNSARGAVSQRKDDIYAAADGLHDLDDARATVSSRKDDLSQSADLALDSLDALSISLAALDRYGAMVSATLDETVGALNDMNSTLQSLSAHLKTTKELVTKLQSDTKSLSEILTDAEGHSDQALRIADNLAWNAGYLEENLKNLQDDMDALERVLRLTSGLTPLTADDLLGLLSADEQAQMKEVLSLHKQYEAYLKANSLTQSQLTFENFIIAGAYQQFCEATVKQAVEQNAPAQVDHAVAQFAQANGRAPSDEELAAIQAQVVEAVTAAAKAALPTLEQFTQAPAAQPYVEQAAAAAAAYDQFSAKLPMVDAVNAKLREVNKVLTNITAPTGRVVRDLNALCKDMTATGTDDDLADLMEMVQDLLHTLDNHKGTGKDLLKNLDGSGDLLSQIADSGDALLGDVDRLMGVVNTHHPNVKQAVADVEALSKSLQATLNTTSNALRQAKDVLSAAGPSLDTGTEKTLNGLTSAVDAVRASGSDLDAGAQATLAGIAAALRQSTSGLGQSSSIRSAKNDIHDLIEDQWDQHSGGVDGLLNMDADATPVSMTSAQNPAPQSVQYVMRTQEIKVEEAKAKIVEPVEPEERSFWQRVGDMFVDLWNGFIGIFS